MKKYRSLFMVNLGCISFALAYILFFERISMTPGGLGGLSIIIGQLTGLSFGTLNVSMNIPVILLGIWLLGWKKVGLTAYAVIVSSALIDLGVSLIPSLSGNLLIAALFGGMLQGTGVGLMLSVGGSVGGTALIGQLISLKLPKLRMGSILLVVDGSIVLLGFFVFGNRLLSLGSLLAIFISTQVIDLVMGRNKLQGILTSFIKTQTAKLMLKKAAKLQRQEKDIA